MTLAEHDNRHSAVCYILSQSQCEFCSYFVAFPSLLYIGFITLGNLLHEHTFDSPKTLNLHTFYIFIPIVYQFSTVHVLFIKILAIPLIPG